MKNYRRLAPGEVIRSGDEFRISPFKPHPLDHKIMPQDVDTVGMPCDYTQAPQSSAAFYRPARTEGCPPGWRWADEGEVSENAFQAGDLKLYPGGGVLGADAEPYELRGRFPWVMPYPEDPRLEDADP